MKAGIESRRFRAEATIEPHQSGSWGSSLIKIFDGSDQVGEYKRNHPGWAKTTFEPFEARVGVVCPVFERLHINPGDEAARLYRSWREEPAAGGFARSSSMSRDTRRSSAKTRLVERGKIGGSRPMQKGIRDRRRINMAITGAFGPWHLADHRFRRRMRVGRRQHLEAWR